MSVQAILAPVFVQVLLTFVLLFWMGRERFAAARAGDVKGPRGAPRHVEWPEQARKVSDCFHNQLELPVLFYVAVVLALVTRQADLLFVALSWVFVVTRCAHAFEHVGRNRTPWRFRAFLAGALVLMGMWLELALKLFVAS